MNEGNVSKGQQFVSLYGHPLGITSPSLIADNQFEFSSGSGYPRLLKSSWVSAAEPTKPWVIVSFRKFVMIKAIQILSPLR